MVKSKIMYDKIMVLADLELFAGKNMRVTPIHNSYRPIFDFKGANTKVSASIKLTDRENLAPGDSATVQITFLGGVINNDCFKEGKYFTISEGRDILGQGRILKRINSKVEI